ncbi:hypothetical protein [Alcanivorax hongdengensis]|uniref:hypothetical protein n=1 Tax=Alcanivorax hongdengensis TaxID=519051 RepID=UPI0012FC3E6D|nr:hypothetical protein [Alcanivorax hongdengensis]
MDIGSNEVSNVLSSFSLLVSGVLAYLYIRDRRHSKFSIANDYINQLLQWHHSVVSILTELRLRRFEETCDDKRALLIELSASIEKGRFFFPNIKQEEYGTDKPPAYRGYRNIGLDFLVASYNLHHKPWNTSLDQQAEKLQRLFTSIVYEIVSPSERLNTIRKLTNIYFVKGLSVEDLQDPKQLSAISHIWKIPKK